MGLVSNLTSHPMSLLEYLGALTFKVTIDRYVLIAILLFVFSLFFHFLCSFLSSSGSFSSGLIIAFSGMPVFQVFVCLLYVPFCLSVSWSFLNPWSYLRGKGKVETILPKLTYCGQCLFSVFPEIPHLVSSWGLEGKETRR